METKSRLGLVAAALLAAVACTQDSRGKPGTERGPCKTDGVCDDGLWFFTMELLQGEDLLAHVRAGWPPPRFDEARLRGALPQLVRGLMALHAAGKIHRDVKPSNVMVSTAGRVVLMDFGLAIDAVDASEESLIGTPHYMAPEQITGQNVGPPADYYAFHIGLIKHGRRTCTAQRPRCPGCVLVDLCPSAVKFHPELKGRLSTT